MKSWIGGPWHHSTVLALVALLAFLAPPLEAEEYRPTLDEAMRCYKRFPVGEATRAAREQGFAGEDGELFVRALRVWPLIKVFAQREGVDPMIAFRIAATESRFEERLRGDSGEIGLYQILPSTGRDLWAWYGTECPEPHKKWEASTPNQISLAIRHMANIQRGLKRHNSLRDARLKDIYAVYCGGNGGLYGKPKKKWVLNNLRVTKALEIIARSMDQLRVVPVARGALSAESRLPRSSSGGAAR